MLIQSKNAKRQQGTPQPFCAGVMMTTVFEVLLDTQGYTAATDKIELGTLPAEAQLIDANLVGIGLGATTAEVGLMSGAPGDDDDTRTVGSELFSGQSVNDTDEQAPLATLLAVAMSDTHRSIGATLSGDVAPGAGKKLMLRINYHM